MEQQNNNKLYIIIGLLGVSVLCLVISVAALMFGNSKEKTPEQQGAENNTEASLLGEEVQQEPSIGSGIAIVTGGFKVVIPADYGCFYAEGIGPVVYMDDVFQMKLKVVDGTYEEAVANPERLTQGTTDAGGTILQDIKETEADGKKYLYYIMELADQECYVIYTQVGDSDKRIAGQIAVESEHVTDEDMIRMFAEIVGSAVATDEADTDEDALAEMIASANRGEVKTESTLSLSDCAVTFRVPEGYYGQGQYEMGDSVSEYFITEDYSVNANCDLQVPVEEGYETAQQYAALMFDWLPEEVHKEYEIQEKEIDGTSYYFYNVTYELEGEVYKELLYTTDVKNGGIYTVTVKLTDGNTELTEDMVREFLYIK